MGSSWVPLTHLLRSAKSVSCPLSIQGPPVSSPLYYQWVQDPIWMLGHVRCGILNTYCLFTFSRISPPFALKYDPLKTVEEVLKGFVDIPLSLWEKSCHQKAWDMTVNDGVSLHCIRHCLLTRLKEAGQIEIWRTSMTFLAFSLSFLGRCWGTGGLVSFSMLDLSIKAEN